MDSSSVGESRVLISYEEEELILHEMAMFNDGIDGAIANMGEFVEGLRNGVNSTDGANTHSLLQSKDKITVLNHHIVDADEKAKVLSKDLRRYEGKLDEIRHTTKLMYNKDATAEKQFENEDTLLSFLNTLSTQLHVSKECTDFLTDMNHDKFMLLRNNENYKKGVLAAAGSIDRVLSDELFETHLMSLPAVRNHHKSLLSVRISFCNKFCSFMVEEVFARQFVNAVARGASNIQQLRSDILKPYKSLITWLRESCIDSQYLENLVMQYASLMKNCYTALISNAVGGSRLKAITSGGGKRKNSAAFFTEDNVSVTSLENDDGCRRWYEQLSRLTNDIEEAYLSETHFMADFFYDIDASSGDVPQRAAGGDATAGGDDERRVQALLHVCSTSIQSALRVMFPNIEKEIMKLLDQGKELDSITSIDAFIFFKNSVDIASHWKLKDTYLSKIFAACLATSKRNINAYQREIEESITKFKLNKQKRCGVMSFVSGTRKFLMLCSDTFARAGVDEQPPIDIIRVLQTIILKVFEEIDVKSLNHPKTPTAVIKAENYYCMYDALHRFKSAELKSERNHAKATFKRNVTTYARELVEKPIEKLCAYFEALETRVKSGGVDYDAISFQTQFSKQEFLRVSREHSIKEVRRGLEKLHTQMKKQFAQNSPLLPTVWHEVQMQMLDKYKLFTDLIGKCYQKCSLEFNDGDIAQCFADIARQQNAAGGGI